MKYDVHIYPLVRVKVSGMIADTPQEAIEEACKTCDFDTLLAHSEFEYAEEIAYFMVDEADDPEYQRSRWYDGVDCSEMPMGKTKRDEFIELIARMKTLSEFGENQPGNDDYVDTLDDLIASARRITGFEGYPEEADDSTIPEGHCIVCGKHAADGSHSACVIKLD